MPRIVHNPHKLPKGSTDWDALKRKTDKEVIEAARADPDAKPLTPTQIGRLLPVVDVKALRKRLGMTQLKFSKTFKLSIGTVRDWEQGRFVPEAPARVLLTVIDRNHIAVVQALTDKKPSPETGPPHPIVPACGQTQNLSELAAVELLRLHSEAIEELKLRGVVRTNNSPLGDYVEYLVCKTFGWTIVPNSKKSFDAIDNKGTRYQIKARRNTGQASDRQLGAIRNLTDEGFDFLVGVLVDVNFDIERAALIPHRLVLENATLYSYTKAWNFYLRDDVWSWPGVDDLTAVLKTIS